MKKVAIFDFDNTVILGDSFLPFLTYATGPVATYFALGKALALYGQRSLNDSRTSLRTFVKNHMLHSLLSGKARASLSPAAEKTRQWQKLNAPVMQSLREHKDNGDIIVIASGGLDLYLPQLLRDIPHDALICTDIGVNDGIVTGDMINGNCVRLRKAERVAEWLKMNGPFDESWGYGNYPHDVPMLQLVKHRILVS
jgi:HAD superfamily hydrolase (TIGR01490 family)